MSAIFCAKIFCHVLMVLPGAREAVMAKVKLAASGCCHVSSSRCPTPWVQSHIPVPGDGNLCPHVSSTTPAHSLHPLVLLMLCHTWRGEKFPKAKPRQLFLMRFACKTWARGKLPSLLKLSSLLHP